MNEDQLTLDANDLIKGAKAPILPPAPEKQSPNDFIGRFADVPKTANDYITKVDTEQSRQRDDILNRLLNNGQQDTGQVYQDTFNNQARQLTGQSGDNLIQQLRDENTKLATLQGQFRTQAQKVSGAQGQSQVFEAPQLNELERERAVQVGNQALLVQALQGNYNTARQIALDTADFATKDRKAELDALITQYNAVQDIVSGQEAQVIAGKKAEAEAEKAELERTQKAVDGAIMSGVATPEEMQKLVSTQTDNATKQALAQQIMARGAGENRTFDRTTQELQQQNIRSQISERGARLSLAERQFAFQQEQAKKVASGEISEKEAEKNTAVEATLQNVSMVRSILNDPQLNASVGPIQGTLPNATADAVRFQGKVDQLKNSLTLENTKYLKGAMSDKDILLLERAASRLNDRMKETDFKSALREIENTLLRGVESSDGNISDDQLQYYFDLPQDDIAEINSVFGGNDMTFDPANFY